MTGLELDRITAYRRLAQPRIVGLISGTSADGIDAALVRLTPARRQLEVERFLTVPYPDSVRGRLFAMFDDQAGLRETARMHVLLGRLFAEAALQLLRGEGCDLIASHGQTVAHLPHPQDYCGFPVAATLQLAESAEIAERTGCLTVSDFRPADVSSGGQGAPLVPFFDDWLLRSPDCDRLALNLGGMANLTFIPRGGPTTGFDTGPGNVLMDALTELATGAAYDEGGRLAAQGQVVESLLAELLAHPYFAVEGPKSTGREEFGMPMARALWGRYPAADLVRTAAALTAESVARALRARVKGPAELFVAGGGCDNPVLLSELEQRLGETVRLRRFEEFGVPAGGREAVAFALLGHQSMLEQPGALPEVTGARRGRILGKLTFP